MSDAYRIDLVPVWAPASDGFGNLELVLVVLKDLNQCYRNVEKWEVKYWWLRCVDESSGKIYKKWWLHSNRYDKLLPLMESTKMKWVKLKQIDTIFNLNSNYFFAST